MSIIRITKQFNFEAGHALYGYDGKCKNVHGHSYKLSVTVSGEPITDNTNVKFGMVIDFSDLKKIVKEEIVTKKFAFASVVTIKNIKSGEKLTKKNIWVKRPGTGEIKAEFYEDVIGKKATVDIRLGKHIKWSDFE